MAYSPFVGSHAINRLELRTQVAWSYSGLRLFSECCWFSHDTGLRGLTTHLHAVAHALQPAQMLFVSDVAAFRQQCATSAVA